MSQDLSVKKLILITYNLGPHSSQNIANFILPHKLTLMKLPSTCLAGYPLKGVLWAVFILLSVSLDAQRLYQISGVEVDRGGNALINAWTGGFNNPVISPIDLDQDGLMDLFIYDKAGFKAQAFINNGAVGSPSYRYAPEYDVTFPKGLTDWAVIRDYNKDGVPDIFALTGNISVAVYRGSRIAGGGLTFTKIKDPLSFTYGAAGVAAVYAFTDNMPVFADVDFDGDMDIMGPEITGTRITYYKNLSVESGFGVDSLIYVSADDCWGNIFLNSGCGVSYFSCKTGSAIPASGDGRAQRDGGGAMYGFDYEGDHDMDLLLADLSCNTIKFLRNDGDSSAPVIGYTDTLFPSYDRSVKLNTFPAAYGADADNDGYQDLMIAPFSTNTFYVMKSEDVKCIQYYHNTGATSPLNRFHYITDTLLTSTTVDVGTESHAVFFDYNGDGLMDMVVGNFGRFRSNPSLTLYTNTGTSTAPRFNEAVTNWSGISSFNLTGVYPAFGDLDGDGNADMVIGDQVGHIYYFRNTGTDTATYPSMTQPNWFGISAGSGAAPFIYDLNGDSLNDLIIGTINGNIKYYWNFGTASMPLFSPDSVNTFLGRATVSSMPPLSLEYRSPVIHKEGNQTFLYSGSREGRVEKYLVDKDSLRNGSFTRISRDVIGISPGLHSTVSIADINGDGYNDYLTGNVRGGLMLFSDVYWGNGVTLPTSMVEIADPNSKVQVYPVPARDVVLCRSISGDDKLMSAHVYDLLGKSVSVSVSEDAEGLAISVAALPTGIYILQVADEKGAIYQRRISVMR
jgi:hypothetical protein